MSGVDELNGALRSKTSVVIEDETRRRAALNVVRLAGPDENNIREALAMLGLDDLEGLR